MVSPKPISLTSGANPNPEVAPQPFVVVGGVPGTALATTATPGTVRKLPAQANSTATDVAGLVADFNALLAKLRTAGILS